MPKSDVRVTVSLAAVTHRRLTALAEESGVSISWVVRYAIDSLLRDRPDGQQMALPLERRALRE